ncbi:MAG TPA: rhomboid family intramembrane serine protease [Polyangiaceae bacterium]|nr:rhomboid family intramembrane serine protease [Polyangiaceae bacterium]
MARGRGDLQAMGLPRPGPGLRGVLIAVFAVWLAFALGVNWAGAPPLLFDALCGNTADILHGQVWRLFTAPFMHEISHNIGHVLWALLGLYFLGPSLESHWGSARFLRFLGLSALFANVTQMLVELVLPATLAARLVPDYWFGSMAVVSAVSIAWALSFRGRTINVMFVIPITSTGLILFVVALNVMYLIAQAGGPEGQIAPFGGMLAGYLFGGGTPSPMRRLWLKLRLAQLDAEARREAGVRKRRVARSGFDVIEGGKSERTDGGSNGNGNGNRGGKKGPDGGWLN